MSKFIKMSHLKLVFMVFTGLFSSGCFSLRILIEGKVAYMCKIMI